MQPGVDHIGVCVVFFCHDGTGRFVMSKRKANARDEQGVWDLGGGRVELHEHVEDTLRREILEEYGTRIVSFEFLGVRDVHRYHTQPTHWVALDYKVRVVPEEVRNAETQKFDAVQWFTKETMPKEIHSQLPIFLEKYARLLW